MLLYVKATMTGDEPVDVLEYRRQHHRFPHQSVLNQFLDEAQWESYRELGQHCASPLFSQRGGLWLADVRNALPAGSRDASRRSTVRWSPMAPSLDERRLPSAATVRHAADAPGRFGGAQSALLAVARASPDHCRHPPVSP